MLQPYSPNSHLKIPEDPEKASSDLVISILPLCNLSSPKQSRVDRYWRIKKRNYRKWQSGRKRKFKSVLNVQSLKGQTWKSVETHLMFNSEFLYPHLQKAESAIIELPCQALSMYGLIKTSMVEVCLCQLSMVGTVILILYEGSEIQSS